MKDKHLLILVPPFFGLTMMIVYFWHEPWSRMRWIGAGMIVAGFAFWTVAHVQLGASFTASAQARKLVTRGLYSRIRNPIYVFGSIGIAGIFLFLQMPWLLLVFLALIPMQIFRARNEARVLENAFGEDYREYRKKTWF
jgi:protein-S-isoprenylcysteine O-methyltransferase Ste14